MFRVISKSQTPLDYVVNSRLSRPTYLIPYREEGIILGEIGSVVFQELLVHRRSIVFACLDHPLTKFYEPG